MDRQLGEDYMDNTGWAWTLRFDAGAGQPTRGLGAAAAGHRSSGLRAQGQYRRGNGRAGGRDPEWSGAKRGARDGEVGTEHSKMRVRWMVISPLFPFFTCPTKFG